MKTTLILLKAFFVLTIYAIPLQAQNKPGNKINNNIENGKWGVGIRLGDPTGISAKKYGQKAAVEFNIGRSYYLYKYSYKDAFYRNSKFKNENYYRFDDYKPGTSMAMQLHILKHIPIKELNGLSWYVGAGPQFRYQKIHYWYYYREDQNSNWKPVNEDYNDFDIGVDITGGLEYTITEIPLSFFLDATLFMEVIDDPFWPWFQSGIGARYNF